MIASTGKITFSDIAAEKDVSQSDIKLSVLSTVGINTDNLAAKLANNTSTTFGNYPDEDAPHRVSEFYGYDHDSGPCDFYESVDGPYASAELACANSPTGAVSLYTKLGQFYTNGSCNVGASSGFYLRAAGGWIELSGAVLVASGTCATTTTTGAPGMTTTTTDAF